MLMRHAIDWILDQFRAMGADLDEVENQYYWMRKNPQRVIDNLYLLNAFCVNREGLENTFIHEHKGE